jgi:flagellar protein FlbT
MKGGFRISLRAGERIYVNGAVLRPDRKVSLEFMNDVAFLLESHVMHPEDTTTPLRQLYFVVQTMLMDPASALETRKMFDASYARLTETFQSEEILAGLRNVHSLVSAHRIYEALKEIRTLFPGEAAILRGEKSAETTNLEVA